MISLTLCELSNFAFCFYNRRMSHLNSTYILNCILHAPEYMVNIFYVPLFLFLGFK